MSVKARAASERRRPRSWAAAGPGRPAARESRAWPAGRPPAGWAGSRPIKHGVVEVLGGHGAQSMRAGGHDDQRTATSAPADALADVARRGRRARWRPWRCACDHRAARGGARPPGCARAALAASSLGSTGTAAWARMGPVSTPASTTCTVQPLRATRLRAAPAPGASMPGKRGQQGRVHVDDAPGEARQHGAAHEAHEAGQHDQLGREARAMLRGQRGVPGRAVGVVLGGAPRAWRCRARARSSSAGAVVAIGDHADDCARDSVPRSMAARRAAGSSRGPRPAPRASSALAPSRQRSRAGRSSCATARPTRCTVSPALVEGALHRVGVALGHHDHQAEAHVEGAVHLGVLDARALLDEVEDGRALPAARRRARARRPRAARAAGSRAGRRR